MRGNPILGKIAQGLVDNPGLVYPGHATGSSVEHIARATFRSRDCVDLPIFEWAYRAISDFHDGRFPDLAASYPADDAARPQRGFVAIAVFLRLEFESHRAAKDAIAHRIACAEAWQSVVCQRRHSHGERGQECHNPLKRIGIGHFSAYI